MKYLPLIVVLFVGFLVSATYAIKAEWIRDRILQWTSKTYGTKSPVFYLQRWFIGNAFYVASFRIAAGVIAICLLAAIICAFTAGLKH